MKKSILKITLWNQDTLTIPYINRHYKPQTIIRHIKALLKNEEQELDNNAQEEEP